MNRIAFFGTSQFAVPILEALCKKHYKIVLIVTTVDKPAGRKQILKPSPVKIFAQKNKLKIVQPQSTKDIKKELEKINPDLVILAAYGKIIPPEALNIPRFGFINIHPSLLPKYRGASPIQTAILNNDEVTGISIMEMDKKLDHGPIISQKEVKISDSDNSQKLEEKLSKESSKLLIKILPDYLAGKIKARPQNEKEATYTKLLKRQDGKINWKKTAKEIESMVKAFYPWPSTWTILKDRRIKVIKVKAVDKEEKDTIKTGKGFIKLELIQPAGKKNMSGEDFFRGNR